jgi:CRISPR-associated protein Cmr6
MVFERPKQPGQSQQRPNPVSRPNQPAKKVIPSRGDRGNSGGGNGGAGGGNGRSGNGDYPSPWLEHPLDRNPEPDSTASFVEYLRWMRSPDSQYKDPTKVQILQIAEENANYRDRLLQLNERTKLIAGQGNFFQVKASWRIRVGGHRGPESILLPAFDALGIPYIPSSTLRGAARTQALRSFMATGLSWKEAERRISRYFGSLEEEGENRIGKVIFLDAYPIPNASDLSGGLAVDMANSIWNWNGEELSYAPNPNPYFSLEKSTFLIGIRRTNHCEENDFTMIQNWLQLGLQSGIGSQINTGYGGLIRAGQIASSDQFFQVEFSLEGQLIHGRQAFTQWTWNDRRSEWQMRGKAAAEVRPTAFKSMLRYWFRAFARGVLTTSEVKRLEANLFGSISPQKRGWVGLHILDGEVIQLEARPTVQGKNDPCGEQTGVLCLKYSSEASATNLSEIASLFKSLTWMMFHLGGVGQGARRPCYSRQTRDRAPWWRGSTLVPESEDDFWDLPDTAQEFQALFRRQLQSFYDALSALAGTSVNSRAPLALGQVRSDRWIEVVDSNSRIVVCSGASRNAKPYALSILHDPTFKQGQDYDGNLCGKVMREVKPSPVWISDLGGYQLVTVFGATHDPRREYLQELHDRTERQNFAQIFPLA